MSDPPSAFLNALLSGPLRPKNWTKAYVQGVIDRTNKRIETLDDRVLGTTQGRVMPDPTDVAIGSGRHFRLSILFLDITGFTGWPSSNYAEQKQILWIMDVFMAEMMNIIRDHGGTFEKNTGDGLMAYFGADGSDDDQRVHAAVEAAILMHYVNDVLLTPWFQQQGLWPVSFRVGIDYGAVTISRIGIHGTNQFVAIGSTANVANRVLRAISNGICIGNEVYKRLPPNWGSRCDPLPATTGYCYVVTGLAYPIWELKYRLAGQPLF